MRVLRLNRAGQPTEWISCDEAVILYAKQRVLWEMGDGIACYRGGHNRYGLRTRVVVAPIISVDGRVTDYVGKINLSNRMLFRRDDGRCLYCGDHYPLSELTRDHVIPKVQHGPDIWTNVVTACKYCNHTKDGRRPEEAGMELLAVPFEPNWCEYLYLQNHHILGDQMDYLKAKFTTRRDWATLAA